jgi:hypothetical protein
MSGRKLPFMGNRVTSDGDVERFLDLPNSWQRTGTLTAERHRLKRRSGQPRWQMILPMILFTVVAAVRR